MTQAAPIDRALDRFGLRRAPSRPKQIHLAVTDRCFLPCLHCDIWKNETPDLPFAVWAEVIDRLSEWCAPASMNFVGGEPLLHKRLEDLMERAHQRGFEVSFNTNGWLVTPARAERLAQTGVSVAYLSLDGATEKTVDHSRGKAGSHAKIMRAWDLFDALSNPRVVIASILHAGNAKEIPQLLEMVQDRDAQLVIQPLYQNFGDNKYDPEWYKSAALFPQDEAACNEIDAALDTLSVSRARGGPVCNSVAQLQTMKHHFRHPGEDNGLTCRAGHTDLAFDAHGNIRLCYFLEPVATVFDLAPLPLVWDGLTALRRRHQVSRCERHCNLLNCNFPEQGASMVSHPQRWGETT